MSTITLTKSSGSLKIGTARIISGGGAVAHSATTGQTPDDHHARDHAATHSDGGADEIDITNLGSGAAPANKIVETDGAGGLQLIDTPSGGGGSGYVDKILALGAAATEVEFGASGNGVLQTPLDGDNDYIYELFFRIVGTSNILIRFNNDTLGANYYTLLWWMQNASGPFRATDGTALRISGGASSGNADELHGVCTIQAATGLYRSAVTHSRSIDTDGSPTIHDVFNYQGVYAGAGNITSIQIISGLASGLGIGSEFQLFKKVAA